MKNNLPIIKYKNVSERDFVNFWASTYIDPRDNLYSKNIGKKLTPKRVLELFEWKNGGTIAKHKIESINKNYIYNTPVPPTLGAREEQIKFILRPGGVIWRIFWLHCHNPSFYPIFDQHVYRAMKYILNGKAEEIPKSNRKKAASYIDEYLPFHARFSYANKKRLDEALWSYGKFLKGPYVL